MRTFIFIVSIGLSATPSFATESVIGRVEQVKDADSIVVNNTEIRLYGIDAPESNQKCKNKIGRNYACGEAASRVLRRLLRNKRVNCEIKGKDQYQRFLGVCRRGVVNVNQYLVAQGWAIAYERYDTLYVSAQALAKRKGVGLWQGEFEAPEVFRRTNLDNNPGSDHAGINAGKTGCTIKGNINSKGQRIYHTPAGSKNYYKTRISENKGERWFCSEAEARAAGWRPPKGG